MLKKLGGKVFEKLAASASVHREARAFLEAPNPPEDAVKRRLPFYLRSKSWQVRNIGVKLIAKLRDPSFYPILIQKVRNCSDTGIVTRNSIASIRRLGLNGPEVEQGLRRALSAHYWEIRCEAAGALSQLFEPSPERTALLVGALKPRPNREAPQVFGEQNVEVRAAVAVALGAVDSPRITMPALMLLANDPHWLVRHQAAVALVELSRTHGELIPQVGAALDGIDILSDGCRSEFPFPRTMAALRRILRNGRSDMEPEVVRRLYIDMKRGWNRRK